MYKSAIVLGMISMFFFMRTAESLIYGQILALIIFMPVEYYLINKKILKDNTVKETIMTMLPSLFIMGAILVSGWLWPVVAFLIAAAVFWAVYLKDKHFDAKLITE